MKKYEVKKTDTSVNVPIKLQGTNKVIYVDRDFAREYMKNERKEWSMLRRKHKCTITNNKGLSVRCQYQCAKCPFKKEFNSEGEIQMVSLEYFMNKAGHEPVNGEWKERQNDEDPKLLFIKKEEV